MGFGSYDESEQENQELETDQDDVETVNVHESEHDGKVTFDTDASTDDLVARLGEMRESSSDD